MTISAFPSPAADYREDAIDLVKHLIRHPSATYVMRATSDAMRDAAILPGSLLLVDTSLQAGDGDIVVARLLSGFTVKRLRLRPRPALVADNPAYPVVYIDEEEGVHIVGVVTTVITMPSRQSRAS